MGRLLWSSIRAHKLRLVLTGVAVVIGTAFLVTTLLLSDTVRSSVDDLGGSEVSDVVVVRGPLPFDADDAPGGALGGLVERPPIDADLLATVEAVDGVGRAAAVSTGPVVLLGLEAPLVGATDVPGTATTWVDDPDLSGQELVEGRAPAAADEIALGRDVASSYGIDVGGTVEVAARTGSRSATVVGLTEPTTSTGALTLGPAVAIAPDSAADLLDLPAGQVSEIRAQADGVDRDELMDRLRTALADDDVDVAPGDELVTAIRELVRTVLDVVTGFLLVFAGIALFVGGFIIFNTFSILLVQRTRETALLRAVGATRRQVLGAMLGEAAATGLVASVLGLVVGVGLFLAVKLAASLFADIDLALVLNPRLLLVVAVGTVLTSVAGVVPSIRAASIPPLAAMRQSSVDESARSWRRAALGGIELAAGVALVVVGSTGGGDASLAALAGGLALTFVAVTTVGPLAAAPFTRALGTPVARLRGVTGRIARDNAARNPRRTAATGAALMIGVTLVVAIAVFASSLDATATRDIESSYRADVIVSGQSPLGLPPEAVTAVEGTDGVARAVPVEVTSAEVAGDVRTVSALDPTAIDQVVDAEVVAGALDDVDDGAIALSKGLADDAGVEVGDQVEVRLPTQTSSLRVAAVYDATDVLGDAVVTPATFSQGVTESGQVVRTILVVTDPGRAVGEVTDALDRALDGVPNVDVTTPSGQASQISQIIQIALVVVYGLLGLSVVIAAIGIANSLALSVFERRHEIALLRAVGMTRAQSRGAVRWEAVLVSLYGTALGLVLGLVFGVVLVSAQDDFVLSFSLLTWVTLVSAAVLGVVVGVLAAVVPAWRASRGGIVEGLVAE